MTAQRITGAWLAVFTVCVVANHLLQGQLSLFDAVYGVFVIPLAASSFWEGRALKLFQVGVIFLAGILMVSLPDYSSRGVGMVIMAFAQMYAYTYGFLANHGRAKLAASAAVYLGIFTLTQENLSTGIMWLLLCFTVHGGIWVCARELIEKARRLDELEKQHLKQTLVASETLLRATIQDGMVLVKEIKCEDDADGCEE